MLKVSILLAILAVNADAANILAVFPVPTLSHQILLRHLTEALENRGHKLTIISTDPQIGRGHENTTEIDLNFSYVLMDKNIFSMKLKDQSDELATLSSWIPMELEMIEKQLASEDVQELLRNREEKKFDAVIVEYVGYTPWEALAEYFNAPLIGITASETTLEVYESMGAGANPIQNPDLNIQYTEIRTFTERFTAWKFYILYNFYYKWKFNELSDQVIRKYLPEVKMSSQELKKRVDLLLINTHPALGYVRPLVPTTVQLGFLHIQPPNEIYDNQLLEFLNNSDKPVIYVSFGSSIKSAELHDMFLLIFRNVFKSLPYNIIWKWELPEMKNKPDNVYITPWTQQPDLLAHPKIKLFITQGGQHSVEEAISRGVPMLVIPFYGDHSANAIKVQKLQIGMALSIYSMDEVSLRGTIDLVMNGGYRENVIKLRDIILDEPMHPVEKAVWWIEHVIRHNGTRHLTYNAKFVPFYQKYMLDFIGIAVLCLYFIVMAIKFIFNLVSPVKENVNVNVKSEKKEQKKKRKKEKEL